MVLLSVEGREKGEEGIGLTYALALHFFVYYIVGLWAFSVTTLQWAMELLPN